MNRPSTFFLIWFLTLLLSLPFFIAEAISPVIKTSDSLYFLLDLQNPSKINFEISLVGKAGLKGEYDAETGRLKAGVSLQELDLKRFSKHLGTPLAGYIKKGNLDIAIDKGVSIKGELEANGLEFNDKDIGLKGDIKLLGRLKTLGTEFEYAINYDIKNGYFAKLKDFQEIQARGFIKNDKLLLTGSELTYKSLPLEATAQIENFSSPKIDLEIISAVLSLITRIQIDQDKVEVSKFTVKSKNSKITSKANIGLKTPRTEIQGKSHIDFSDIADTADSFGLKLSYPGGLNPQGSLDLEFAVNKNPGRDKGSWRLSGNSNQVKIKGIKLKDLTIDLSKTEDTLDVSSLETKVSRGEIKLNGKIDLSNNQGTLNLTAKGIDINQTLADLNVPGKKPRGELSLEVNLKSLDLFKWKNLLGEGSILLSDGDIYQIKFLEGLGKFLSIPDFENIVFERASSDLLFEGEKIVFKNFRLSADQMSMEGEGKITTAGNIDLLLRPQFEQDLIASSKGLQKYLSAILGNGTFSIKVSGTVKNPQYTANVSIAPALDNIENIKDILGNFVDW